MAGHTKWSKIRRRGDAAREARVAEHRERLTISERYHERMLALRRKSTRVDKTAGQ